MSKKELVLWVCVGLFVLALVCQGFYQAGRYDGAERIVGLMYNTDNPAVIHYIIYKMDNKPYLSEIQGKLGKPSIGNASEMRFYEELND